MLLNPNSQSDLLNLFRLHNRICFGYSISACTPVIEWAIVLLRVPVDRAECPPAAALEPGQPSTFAAGHAAVWRMFDGILRWGALAAHSSFHLVRTWHNRLKLDGTGCRCLLQNWDDRGCLWLLLHEQISVAFGTKIVGGSTSEEAAVVGTQDWAFRWLAFGLISFLFPALLCHVCWTQIQNFLTKDCRSSRPNSEAQKPIKSSRDESWFLVRNPITPLFLVQGPAEFNLKIAFLEKSLTKIYQYHTTKLKNWVQTENYQWADYQDSNFFSGSNRESRELTIISMWILAAVKLLHFKRSMQISLQSSASVMTEILKKMPTKMEWKAMNKLQ